jgi:hypothetical protein
LFAIIDKNLRIALSQYIIDTDVGDSFEGCVLKEVRFKKYNLEDAGFIGWHCDGANFENCDRVLQCLMYFNTVNEGGKTDFYVGGQELSIDPVEGRVAMFPPSFQYLHKADAPKDCSKYIAVASFAYTPFR